MSLNKRDVVDSDVMVSDTQIKRRATDMIEQKAIVVNVSKGYAWVKPEGGNSCGSCTSKKGCGSLSIFSLFERKEFELQRVLNPMHAKPGEHVVIGLQSGQLLTSSLLAYILPLITLIIFSIGGGELFKMLGYQEDLGAIMFGAAGLFFGFGVSRFVSKRLAANHNIQPVILRVQDNMANELNFMPRAI